MDADALANAVAQRKKDKSITWLPYLPHDDKVDIQEIYERLDIDGKGYFTQQELHAAINEGLGKPVRAETVRPLALRMDVASRRGNQVSHNDFLEYMAQKTLVTESYDDLMRTEQGALMREVGYKLHEVLSMFKRKQMIKDAMMGADGIARLLHHTNVPLQQRHRRNGQPGSDLMHSDTKQAANASASASTSATTASRNRPRSTTRSKAASSSLPQRSSPTNSRPDTTNSKSANSTRSGGIGDSNTLSCPKAPLAALSATPAISKLKSSRVREGQPGALTIAVSPTLAPPPAGPRPGEDKEPVQRWRKGVGLPAGEDSTPVINWSTEDAIAYVGEMAGLSSYKRRSEDQAAAVSKHSARNSPTTTSVGMTLLAPSSAGASSGLAAASSPTCASPERPASGSSSGPSKPRVLSASAPIPTNLTPRSTLGIAIPGRGHSRSGSPAPSPLGPACQLLLGSPLSGAGTPWRSPTLLSQVMEAEHVGVSEAATPGLLSLEDPVSHVFPAFGSQLHSQRSRLRKPTSLMAARTTVPSASSTGYCPSMMTFRSQTLSAQSFRDGGVVGRTVPGVRGSAGQVPFVPPSGVLLRTTADGDPAGAEGIGAAQPPLSPAPQHQPQLQPPTPHMYLQSPSPQLHQQQRGLPQQGITQSEEDRRRDGRLRRAWIMEELDLSIGPGPSSRESLTSLSGSRSRARLPTRAPSAESTRPDVSDPLAADPVLSKLPNWVRKGIGLPTTAPVEPPLQPEPHPHQVTVAPVPPLNDGGAPPAPAGSSPQPHPPAARSPPPPSGFGSPLPHDPQSPQPRPHGMLHVGGPGPGLQVSCQPTVRFVPFGGNSMAVVAEEDLEGGETGETVAAEPAAQEEERPAEPRVVELAASADEVIGDTGAAPQLPPNVSGGHTGEHLATGSAAAPAPEGDFNPPGSPGGVGPAPGSPSRGIGPRRSISFHLLPHPLAHSHHVVLPEELQAALDATSAESEATGGASSALRFLKPTFLSFRDTGAAAGTPGGATPPTPGVTVSRDQLAAWEASVLSRRSSLGHGSVPDQESESESDDQVGPETADEIYDRLFGASRKADSPVAAGDGGGQDDGQQVRAAAAGTSTNEDAAAAQRPLVQEPKATASGSGGSSGVSDGYGGRSPGVWPARMPYMETVDCPQSARPASAVDVLVAVEAAVAAEAAASAAQTDGSSTNSSRSSLTREGRARLTRWSVQYVGPAAPGGGGGGGPAAADGLAPHPPVVRVNHTAMLRLHNRYSTETIASAGPALGLACTSAAARDVATRQLLSTLGTASDGVRNQRLCRRGHTPGASSTSRDSSSTEGDAGDSLAASSSGGSQTVGAWSRGASAGRGPQGSGAGGLHPTPLGLLPSDAVAAGRTYRRQSSQQPSNSGTNSARRPSSARIGSQVGAASWESSVVGRSGGNSSSRPASAAYTASGRVRPVVPSGNTPRLQSADGAANAMVNRSLPGAGPMATATGQASVQMGENGGVGMVVGVGGEYVDALRARPGSARVPVNHTAPSIAARVRKMSDGEVATCLHAAAALSSPAGASQQGLRQPTHAAGVAAAAVAAAGPATAGGVLVPSPPSAVLAGCGLRGSVGVKGGRDGEGNAGPRGGSDQAVNGRQQAVSEGDAGGEQQQRLERQVLRVTGRGALGLRRSSNGAGAMTGGSV